MLQPPHEDEHLDPEQHFAPHMAGGGVEGEQRLSPRSTGHSASGLPSQSGQCLGLGMCRGKKAHNIRECPGNLHTVLLH